MTRESLLQYITETHGDALAQVGLMPLDVPESLFYVIDDSLRMNNDAAGKDEADRRVAVLIHDRAAMLDLDIEVQPEIDPQPQPEPEPAPIDNSEGITDVSDL